MSPSRAFRRLVPFDSCHVANTSPPVLLVTGRAPGPDLEIQLLPGEDSRHDGYRRIEVIGRPRPAGRPRTEPLYTVSLPLLGLRGAKGVEVVGEDRREQVRFRRGGRAW